MYYEDLAPRPPGAQFSPEWGLQESFSPGTRGKWQEFDPYEVVRLMDDGIHYDMSGVQDWAKRVERTIANGQLILRSATSLSSSDPFLGEVASQAAGISVLEIYDAEQVQLPSSYSSRDSLAVSQGLQLAPHQTRVAEIAYARSAKLKIEELRDLSDATMDHIKRMELRISESGQNVGGGKIFMGHGRSDEWRKLKDFLQDRLGLPWDEFNRVPIAGQTNIARLSEMLDSAEIAFLVLTAEDEMADGEIRARENVVHEAGLFQGRLGFNRAILLVEDGCSDFSNVHGLGQIRFPKASLESKFEEIRRVLEREGII